MDGYYSQQDLLDIPLDQRDSQALDCVVTGVDLVLDASNHESLNGIIFRDLFRGAHSIDIQGKLPGYVMGGVDLDHLFEVVLNN